MAIRKEILELITLETYPEVRTGGQMVGTISQGIKLSCLDCGFAIIVDGHRSALKNRELALTFFELYLIETKQC